MFPITNLYPKSDDGCKALKEAAELVSSCCMSCHDSGRSDTRLTEVEYNGQKYLVCCHIKRAFDGITFAEALERNGY